jgi:hypothetical protein
MITVMNCKYFIIEICIFNSDRVVCIYAKVYANATVLSSDLLSL